MFDDDASIKKRKNHLCICYQFFKQLRNKFGRKPIMTDGATWYYQACRWLRMKHFIYGPNLKNKMERFVQKIKDRTKCFDDHFPCTKNDCNRLHVYNWLKLYILYIHTDMDKIL